MKVRAFPEYEQAQIAFTQQVQDFEKEYEKPFREVQSLLELMKPFLPAMEDTADALQSAFKDAKISLQHLTATCKDVNVEEFAKEIAGKRELLAANRNKLQGLQQSIEQARKLFDTHVTAITRDIQGNIDIVTGAIARLESQNESQAEKLTKLCLVPADQRTRQWALQLVQLQTRASAFCKVIQGIQEKGAEVLGSKQQQAQPVSLQEKSMSIVQVQQYTAAIEEAIRKELQAAQAADLEKTNYLKILTGLSDILQAVQGTLRSQQEQLEKAEKELLATQGQLQASDSKLKHQSMKVRAMATVLKVWTVGTILFFALGEGPNQSQFHGHW
jgi:hypothetical protein